VDTTLFPQWRQKREIGLPLRFALSRLALGWLLPSPGCAFRTGQRRIFSARWCRGAFWLGTLAYLSGIWWRHGTHGGHSKRGLSEKFAGSIRGAGHPRCHALLFGRSGLASGRTLRITAKTLALRSRG